MYLELGEPQKWLFCCETNSLEIECDSKKQLTQKLKIQLKDNLGNSAECPPDVEPLVSVEHSPTRRWTIVFACNLARVCFTFNKWSVIRGGVGMKDLGCVTLKFTWFPPHRLLSVLMKPPHCQSIPVNPLYSLLATTDSLLETILPPGDTLWLDSNVVAVTSSLPAWWNC